MASFLSFSRHFSSSSRRSKLLLSNPRNPRSNLLSYYNCSSLTSAGRNPSSTSTSDFISSAQRFQNPSPSFTGSSPPLSRVLLALTQEKPINPVSFLFRSFSLSSSSASTTTVLERIPSSSSNDQDSDDSSKALTDEIRQNVDGIFDSLSDIVASLAFPWLAVLGSLGFIGYLAQAPPLVLFELLHPPIVSAAVYLSWAIMLQRAVKPTVSLKNISGLSRGLALVGISLFGYGGFLFYATTLSDSVSYIVLVLSADSLVPAFLLRQAPKLKRLWELEEHARLSILTDTLKAVKPINRC